MRNLKKSLRIICLIITAVLLFSLTGCFSLGDGYYSSDSIANNNEIDFETLIRQEWNYTTSSEQPEFMDLFDQNSSYQILSITEEAEDYYSVLLDVSSPDISESLFIFQSEITSGLYGDNLSEMDFNTKICELINSATIKTTQQYITVIIDKDGNAHVNFTQDFVNAMYGYAYSDAIDNVANTLQ